jgi:S-DNA-T family DNA segregation ATPase FtsK/SpoIIIE
MLYQAPDAAAPSRVQGVYVSDMEINRITRYWKEAQLNQRESKPAPVLSVSSFDASDKPSGKNGGEPPQGRTERLGPIAISGSSANTSQKAFFDAIREPESSKGDGEGGEDDEMYTEAVALFKKTNKVSISLLQRRLRIGFTRAARLIDLMKQRGVLGASDISTSDNDDEN